MLIDLRLLYFLVILLVYILIAFSLAYSDIPVMQSKELHLASLFSIVYELKYTVVEFKPQAYCQQYNQRQMRKQDWIFYSHPHPFHKVLC